MHRYLKLFMHIHLIELRILIGHMFRSRSWFKVKGHIASNFNIDHNFLTICHTDLKLSMHMYLMQPRILIGHMSSSRSPFKVKGQIKLVKLLKRGHSCFTNTIFLFFFYAPRSVIGGILFLPCLWVGVCVSL